MYTGDGTYGANNPTMLTFDTPPTLTIITDVTRAALCIIPSGATNAYSWDNYAGATNLTVTWDDNAMKVYDTHTNSSYPAYAQMNGSNIQYLVVTFRTYP